MSFAIATAWRSSRRHALSAVVSAALGLSAFSSHASLVLTNGSFESTDSLFNGAIGGLFAATGWTHLSSGTPIQASSALPGFEGVTSAGVTGSRYLRLVSDLNAIGFIAQDMGTMVAGERYSLLGDVLGGGSVNTTWAATISFASDSAASPAAIYATQHLAGYGAGVNSADAISLSYLATAADDGKHLYLWMRADAVANNGTASRGGVDNLRLTVTTDSTVPEPAGLALTGLALALCRRPGTRSRSCSGRRGRR